MSDFWRGLPNAARVGLGLGIFLVFCAVIAATWWLFRPEYQVLFSELKAQDAATLSSELDKQKIPYRLAHGGTSILVDQAQVHQTRLKLMGKELPLHGSVGFELFNNSDFGMTEFVQKINFQRALQGELTRTILALAEVKEVRVHLSLPEQGLFKQAASKAKAAINLTMKPGHVLRAEQVSGIQRLVAAATPGMSFQDVTVVDNHGVALSRTPQESEAELSSSGTRLDLKRETENYLSKKVGVVLAEAFGAGQGLASVDVTLNMDFVRTTTEEVLSAPLRRNGTPTGVVVRERESVRDMASPSSESRSGGFGASPNSTQREIEYQVGRRVEQLVTHPGAIRRIQVVAVIRKPIDPVQEEQLRRLLAATVGASPERGDMIVVQTYGTPMRATAESAPAIERPVHESGISHAASKRVGPEKFSTVLENVDTRAILWAAAAFIALALVWAGHRGRARGRRDEGMNKRDRELALDQVRKWLDQGQSSAGRAS